MRIYAIDLSGAPQATHRHEEDELLFCRSGSGSIRCGDQQIRLEAGEILCIPPDVAHTVLPAEQILCVVHPQSIEPLFHAQMRLRDFDGSFGKLFDMAEQAQERETPYWQTYVNGLCGVMYRLLQCWSADYGTTQHQIVLRLEQSVRTHGLEPEFDLQEEIRRTGYSASYVRHLFKDGMGISPQLFLNRFRIGFAKAQMRASRNDLTIKELSLRCGFQDPYYFSRVFKNIEGISPREYLKRLE